MSNVTLQVSLAPTDWRHAQHILPHQLRQWGTQVDEVLLTLDVHRSSGRFARGWKEGEERIQALIRECSERHPHVRAEEIDYGENVQQRIAEKYFGRSSLPAKDYRGGPFYTYFYGIHVAGSRWVLHLDSDMMFGGGSQKWVDQAIEVLKADTNILVCSPLPGPPMNEDGLRTQTAPSYSGLPNAFRFSTVSTRLFLLDEQRLRTQICPLRLRYPSFRNIVKATVEGNPSYDLPENILSDAMKECGLSRVDFLGRSPGMWSLHPPYRNEEFYQRLPEIVERIEEGVVPVEQRGDHDLNDSMVDWSDEREAIRRNRWWKRLWRKACKRVANQVGSLTEPK